MIKSVGFRNIAVHEYSKVNWEVVYSIVKTNLSDFKDFAREVLKWTEQADEN